MPNPRLATRYAKSLIGLAQERGELEIVYKDMQFLQSICKSNPDFVSLLRSPVVKADKKEAIINIITKDRISKMTSAFTKLLTDKGREEDLPEIIAAFITQYNEISGIQKVKLTTAIPVSDDVKRNLLDKVKKSTGFDKVEMETVVNPNIIGGFILEYNNNLVDASVSRDLKDISKQFQENVYIRNIR
jgi:F-type H+-transporting ATPase subunit delta